MVTFLEANSIQNIEKPLLQTSDNVAKAYHRIKQYIRKTPLLYYNMLNKTLNSRIYFKMDAIQETGSFKIRGVLNHLLSLKEKGELPSKIVSYSTGNHALAMAYAANLFNIKAKLYLPSNVSLVKKSITERYGAEVISTSTRQEAEDRALFDSLNGYHYLHPSDHDYTIAGAGTLCYEALIELKQMNQLPDIIFAPCGGGGLLSGSYLAKEVVSPKSKLYGVEPKNANDAYQSIQNSKIYRFKDSPDTTADGLRALSISERTFNYLKRLDGFDLVEEETILYWSAWLTQMTKVACEPSAAVSMAAAYSWLQNPHNDNSIILVLITGGNVDPEFYREISNTLNLFPAADII